MEDETMITILAGECKLGHTLEPEGRTRLEPDINTTDAELSGGNLV